MNATTYTQFSNALADLVVAGVTKRYRYLPTQLSTANLPAQFPRLPVGRETPLTADGQGGWPQLTGELVIAVEPLAQSRSEQSHALTLTLIDALNTALRGIAPGTLCKSKHTWSVTGRQDVIGEVDYWVLVATVTGNG
jgi:hypothetical protein